MNRKMRRRGFILATLGLALVGLLTVPAAAQQKDGKDGRIVQDATIAATYYQYACNPSATSWSLKGQWGDGTVLEARACLREMSDGDVQSVVYARTRRGGTAIQSDWNLTEATGSVYSLNTGYHYGWRDNWGDAFNTSIVTIVTYEDCSTVAGNDQYHGAVLDWTANPNGSLPVSGWKQQYTAEQINSGLDCGRQLW